MRRRRAGFTLMEILISLGILVVGMTGIYGVYLSATQQHAQAVDRTNAAIAARGLLENARMAIATNPRADLGKPLTGRVPGMEDYEYSMTFTRLDDSGLRVLVELTLEWRRRGNPVKHRFRTVALRQELPR